ncbi:MAG: hypothetical protein DI596_06780 [Azospira oryzae]|nr:MAG: hypothetical protein DI596_06780 [Azospira oryzae]PZP80253.1 MAG: hypothetical protein DI593_06780 [Azospira oryzae]
MDRVAEPLLQPLQHLHGLIEADGYAKGHGAPVAGLATDRRAGGPVPFQMAQHVDHQGRFQR